MNSIVIQFHATLEELVEYVNSMSSEYSLILTIMILKPLVIREPKNVISVAELKQDGRVRVLMTDGIPNVNACSPNNFLDTNPGTIVLDIGQLSDEGLNESALSFLSDDSKKFTVAKKLASKLRKITKTGVVAVNPETGAEAKIRSHRFTEGAKHKYDGGIKILPVAGNSLIKLPD